jgi:hypothetical protein
MSPTLRRLVTRATLKLPRSSGPAAVPTQRQISTTCRAKLWRLWHTRVAPAVPRRGALQTLKELSGRGLHSSTSQLNLSRFCSLRP